MLNFSTRNWGRSAPYRPRRTVLGVERLETRNCPAGPSISSLTATVLANKVVSLTGTVTDSNPASVTVTFSGVLAGSTPANAGGSFSYWATGTNVGMVSAVAVDGQNLASPSVPVMVSTPAPNVTLAVTYGSKTNVTLSGTVTDVDAGSLTITFSGEVTGSVRTNPNGSFSYTAAAAGPGSVTASTVDLWNQASNNATVYLTDQAPTITNFQATQGPSGWTFTGTVTCYDQSSAGLTVTFGGFPDLAGKTTTVQANGTFTFTIQLSSSDHGSADAVTTDWWGLTSNPVYCTI
jgi:hypothetical protein